MLQLLSAPLQNGLCFFQSPLPAIPSAFLADAPAPEPGRNVGFTRLDCTDTNELALATYTGSLGMSVCSECQVEQPTALPFWPEPVSVFGSLVVTVPTAVHVCWAFHSACSPDRLDARGRGTHLTAGVRIWKMEKVVPAASDQTVASLASAGRLLRTEPQVRSMFSC